MSKKERDKVRKIILEKITQEAISVLSGLLSSQKEQPYTPLEKPKK